MRPHTRDSLTLRGTFREATKRLSGLTRGSEPVARRLASYPDAARYVGVDVRTIRNWVRDGVVPAYRLGTKTVRVDLNEVDEALCQPIVPTAKAGDAA
jgi:excisionase family DNA binding protein